MNNIANAQLLRQYVCAQCLAPLVERAIDGAFTVQCPQACQPGGFITRTSAKHRIAESKAQLEEVARNYPQLDTRPQLSQSQRTELNRALWGDD